MTKRNNIITLLLDIWHFLLGGQQCCPQDRKAMRIADRSGMTHEYKTARRHNMRPLQVVAIAQSDMDLAPAAIKLVGEKLNIDKEI